MIEKIYIKNFKSHADTTIELGRVTGLVGPHGCGKSTVLQTIYEFNRIVERIVKLGQWSLEPLTSILRKQQYEWGICVNGKKYETTEWQIQLKETSSDLNRNKQDWYVGAGRSFSILNSPFSTPGRKMLTKRAAHCKRIEN